MSVTTALATTFPGQRLRNDDDDTVERHVSASLSRLTLSLCGRAACMQCRKRPYEVLSGIRNDADVVILVDDED